MLSVLVLYGRQNVRNWSYLFCASYDALSSQDCVRLAMRQTVVRHIMVCPTLPSLHSLIL